MELSDRTVQAIVTAAVGIAGVLLLRWVLRRAFARYERALDAREPEGAMRRKTTFSFLQRAIVAIAAAIVAWNILSIFPATQQVGRALLASSAVLAVFAGLALSTPLGNFGSGVLLALTQPIRLGDRVTIGESTGFVEAIHLIYTTLATDDDRRIFIPNTQLTSSVIVNRSAKDPRRAVTATLPVRLGAPLDEARAILLHAASAATPFAETRVTVSDVGNSTCSLTIYALTPPGTDVGQTASEFRERGLSALDAAGFLP